MTPSDLLLDSAVLIYAVGDEHPLRAPSRALVATAAVGPPPVTTSLAVQEFLHQRRRRGRSLDEACQQADDYLDALAVLDLEVDDVRTAASLLRDVPALDVADACHAAVALRAGVSHVVSPDPSFDSVDGLVRLDPAQAVARLS